jgi:predicted permease
MKAARQQHDGLDFPVINWLQVPAAYLAMALLPVIALFALRRKSFADIGELAAAVMLAMLANAAVFGILATAHDRYGARMVWLACLAVALAIVRARESARDIPPKP